MAEPTTPEVADAPGHAPEGFFAALRHAPFRYLFLNSFLSWFGAGFNMITLQDFAIGVLRSAGREAEIVRAVGLIPFFSLLPLFLFSVFAGALVDRMDKRRLLVGAQTVRVSGGVLFVFLYFTGELTIPLCYAISFAMGTVQAVVHPTRLTLGPDLVPKKFLMNAMALLNLSQHGSMILGPVIAGFLIHWVGLGASFLALATIQILSVVPLLFLKVPQPADGEARQPQAGVGSVLHEVRAGLRDAWRNHALRQLLLTSAVPGLFFIGPFTALVPLLSREVYGAGVRGQGMLQGALGLGLIMGGLFIARSHGMGGRGLKMVSVLTFGGFIWFLIGSIPSMAVGLALMFLWGASGGIVLNLNITLVQHETSDAMRGRMMSIATLCNQGAGPIGNLISTALAATIGARLTVGLGVQHTIQLAGACVVATTLTLLLMRARVLQLD